MPNKHSLPPAPPGRRYIFRPWRRCPKTGRRIHASEYGLKAFPILIPE